MLRKTRKCFIYFITLSKNSVSICIVMEIKEKSQIKKYYNHQIEVS